MTTPAEVRNEAMVDDGRMGLPSGSAMARIRACPPSHKAALASEPEPGGEDAESGEAIHAALAGHDHRPLTDAEEDTRAMCERDRRAVVDHWMRVFDLDEFQLKTELEKRFYVRDEALLPVASTRMDGVLIADYLGGPILAWDYKTGRGDHDPAAENYQLRTNVAALVSSGCQRRTIMVALIQPWAGKPTVATYEPELAMEAYREIVALSQAAIGASDWDRRSAGEHCRYCPARTHCDEFEKAQTVVANLPTSPQSWAMVEPEQKREALRLWKSVKRAGYLIESRIRDDLERDPESIPGVRLKEGVVRRQVTNPGLAYELTVAEPNRPGIPPEQFAALCEVPIGKLEDAWARAVAGKGEIGQKKLEIAHRLEDAGAISRKQNRPSVELVEEEA